MRIGHLPGQAEMLRDALAFARQDGRRQATRRALIAGALGIPIVAGGGYLAGTRAGSAGRSATIELPHDGGVDASVDGQVELAMKLALAPDGELLAGAHSFLFVLARRKDHPLLWSGFGRLGEHALRQNDSRLIERLRQVAGVRTAPAYLSSLVARLSAAK